MSICTNCHRSFPSIDFSDTCLSCREDQGETDWMYKEVKKEEPE